MLQSIIDTTDRTFLLCIYDPYYKTFPMLPCNDLTFLKLNFDAHAGNHNSLN